MGFEITDERSSDSGWQYLCKVHDATCERRHIERERKRGEG
jgi:hypothetical protein